MATEAVAKRASTPPPQPRKEVERQESKPREEQKVEEKREEPKRPSRAVA